MLWKIVLAFLIGLWAGGTCAALVLGAISRKSRKEAEREAWKQGFLFGIQEATNNAIRILKQFGKSVLEEDSKPEGGPRGNYVH